MEEEWLGELNTIASRPGKLAFAIALKLTRRRAFAAPGEDSMTEIHDRPAGVFAGLNGRKTLLILPTVIFAIAAYGVSFLLPVRYASETLILIRPREVPSSLVVDLIAGSAEERFKAIEQTVMSRTNLVAILREFPQLNSGRDTMDRRIENLRNDITVRITPSAAAFRIRYAGSDPELAQKIAGRLTLLFLQQDGATREAHVAGTREFLQRRLDSIGERLTQKGDELARVRAADGPEAARLLALDYKLLESTYSSVFTKHEEVETAIALENEQKGGHFVIVDAANLPRTPVLPNRLAITGLGALAGLALGGMALVGLGRRQQRALA
jgi:uncharacterized protein involved in exopolysaccharide biosynthesis